MAQARLAQLNNRFEGVDRKELRGAKLQAQGCWVGHCSWVVGRKPFLESITKGKCKVRLKAIVIYLCLLILPILGAACRQTSTVADLGPISSENEAVEKINGFVISKVGEDFFRSYITYQNVSYHDMSTVYYNVSYYFNMPEYDFVHNAILEVRCYSPGGCY